MLSEALFERNLNALLEILQFQMCRILRAPDAGWVAPCVEDSELEVCVEDLVPGIVAELLLLNFFTKSRYGDNVFLIKRSLRFCMGAAAWAFSFKFKICFVVSFSFLFYNFSFSKIFICSIQLHFCFNFFFEFSNVSMNKFIITSFIFLAICSSKSGLV